MLALQLGLVVPQALAVQHVPLDLAQLLLQGARVARRQVGPVQRLAGGCDVCGGVLSAAPARQVREAEEQVDGVPARDGLIVHVPVCRVRVAACGSLGRLVA